MTETPPDAQYLAALDYVQGKFQPVTMDWQTILFYKEIFDEHHPTNTSTWFDCMWNRFIRRSFGS